MFCHKLAENMARITYHHDRTNPPQWYIAEAGQAGKSKSLNLNGRASYRTQVGHRTGEDNIIHSMHAQMLAAAE
jgi:hypothetical protein